MLIFSRLGVGPRHAGPALFLFGIGVMLAAAGLDARAEEPLSAPGQPLYRAHCASCHESGATRAPDAHALAQYRPERISFALMFGMMSQQGRDLSQGEIQDIVQYLVGSSSQQPQPIPDSSCRDLADPVLAANSLPHWNGWGLDIAQRRFQPAAMAQLSPDDVPRMKLKWTFGFPGDTKAYAQPTVWGRPPLRGQRGR